MTVLLALVLLAGCTAGSAPGPSPSLENPVTLVDEDYTFPTQSSTSTSREFTIPTGARILDTTVREVQATSTALDARESVTVLHWDAQGGSSGSCGEGHVATIQGGVASWDPDGCHLHATFPPTQKAQGVVWYNGTGGMQVHVTLVAR